MKTWLREVVGSWNLESSSKLSRLGLEGLFDIRVLQLYSLLDQFQLGGSHKGFSSSTLVSSSITRLNVILCLHLSSLLFKLYIYCLLYMLMP